MRDLDVAFVSPWLLEAVLEKKGRVDARHVVCYHQTPDEKVPAFQDRLVPQQNQTFVVDGAADGELPVSEFALAARKRCAASPTGSCS